MSLAVWAHSPLIRSTTVLAVLPWRPLWRSLKHYANGLNKFATLDGVNHSESLTAYLGGQLVALVHIVGEADLKFPLDSLWQFFIAHIEQRAVLKELDLSLSFAKFLGLLESYLNKHLGSVAELIYLGLKFRTLSAGIVAGAFVQGNMEVLGGVYLQEVLVV